MKQLTWVLAGLTLAACQTATTPTPPPLQSAATLPPAWTTSPDDLTTPMPSRMPVLGSNQSATTSPTSPAEEGTWSIHISAPPEWYGAEAMVELSDQTVLAMGPIRTRSGQQSIWLARLTRHGEVQWVRTVSMPEGSTFGTWGSMDAGLDSTALITGWYHFAYADPDGSTGLRSQPTTLFIDPYGQIAWQAPFATGSFQPLDNGDVLISAVLGANRLNASGDLVWQAELDFGEAFSKPHPLAPPYPGIFWVQLLNDEGLIFAGDIVDVYYDTPTADRSGYMEGSTAYWYARFADDGTLLWKHVHPINPFQQVVYDAITTADGNLVFAGYQSAGSLSGTWLRKIDPKGKTIFHKRYIDLKSYDLKMHATPDGGLVFFGRYLSSFSDNDNHAQLIKMDTAGEVEWARTFPFRKRISAALPLSDGSYLIAFSADYGSDAGLGFARLDTQGRPLGCPDLMPEEAPIRVDLVPPLFDEADQIHLTLSFLPPQEEEQAAAGLELAPVEYEVTELCRASVE